MRTKLFDLLKYPLIVGIIIATFQFLIPRIIKDSKQLTYIIEGPITYIDKNNTGDLSIFIDSMKTDLLCAYNVQIFNTGNLSIKQQPIRFVFENAPKNFKIFSTTIKTRPDKEFGNITEEKTDSISKRFVYELINPNDTIILTFLTNNYAHLSLYAKSENLKFKNKSPEKSSSWLNLIALIGAIIASFLTLILKLLDEKFIKKLKNVFTYSTPSKQQDDIGKVFPGEWELTYTMINSSSSEHVKITEDGKYYANGVHRFNLHDRIIDLNNKRLVFSKVLKDGRLHSTEDLIIKDNKVIEGKDSIGYSLKYEKL